MSQQSRKALWLLVAGFTWWLFAFGGLYALQALGCRYEWTHHRAIVICVALILLLPMAWLALKRPYGDALHVETLTIAALWANRCALAAAVLVFAPTLFATLCV